MSSKRFLEAVEATKLNLGTHPILLGEPINQTLRIRTRIGGGDSHKRYGSERHERHDEQLCDDRICTVPPPSMNGLADWEVEGRKRTVKVAAAIQRVAAREVKGVVEPHGREDEEEAGENPLHWWQGAVRVREKRNRDRGLTRMMYKGSRTTV